MTTPPTFEEKVSILTQIMMNTDPEMIAQRFNTTIEQIELISQNRWKIMEVCHYLEQTKSNETRGGHYPRTEKVLNYWLGQQLTNITNRAIAAKAREIIEILVEVPAARNVPVFTGTNNWVNAFKARYGIRRTTSNPDPEPEDSSASTNENDKTTWSEDSAKQIETSVDQEPEEDTYNAEEEVKFKAEPEGLQSQDIPFSVDEVPIKIESISSLSDYAGRLQYCDQDYEPADQNDLPIESNGRQNDSSIGSNNFSAGDYAQAVINLNGSQEDADDVYTANIDDQEALNAAPKSRKRKPPSVIADDEDTSLDELSDGSRSRKKIKNEQVLVPSRKSGLKSVNLIDYLEDNVIKIFKPILKLAKDSGWCQQDKDDLIRLYTNSLNRCNIKAEQGSIAQYFKKNK